MVSSFQAKTDGSTLHQNEMRSRKLYNQPQSDRSRFDGRNGEADDKRVPSNIRSSNRFSALLLGKCKLHSTVAELMVSRFQVNDDGSTIHRNEKCSSLKGLRLIVEMPIQPHRAKRPANCIAQFEGQGKRLRVKAMRAESPTDSCPSSRLNRKLKQNNYLSKNSLTGSAEFPGRVSVNSCRFINDMVVARMMERTTNVRNK